MLHLQVILQQVESVQMRWNIQTSERVPVFVAQIEIEAFAILILSL